ncbi:MAG: PD40 domain-containing protein [Planctomycetes bacterium]|nr:PD40 domain-containing protein [Planctomycetota bacterium]
MPANGASTVRGVSQDARYVLFESRATNLAGLIFPPMPGLYLRDRIGGFTTSLAWFPPFGRPGDGSEATISSDGRFLAFVASNDHVGHDDEYQVWAFDRLTGVQSLVSSNSFGIQGDANAAAPSLSGDGRWVAFSSQSTNLDSASASGEYDHDVFLKDRITGATTVASVTPLGVAGTGTSLAPKISRNGRRIVFNSSSTQLVAGTPASLATGVFVYDTLSGLVSRVDVAAGVHANSVAVTGDHALSGEGRWVAFASWASNLVADDSNLTSDVFVRDLSTGTVERVSVSSGGAQGNDGSFSPSISSDGRYVAFRSYASNLVSGDSNGVQDVFVRDRLLGTTKRISRGNFGVEADGASTTPMLCGDGFAVIFDSVATNLAGSDSNGVSDVFLADSNPPWSESAGSGSPFALWLRTVVAWWRNTVIRVPPRLPNANG